MKYIIKYFLQLTGKHYKIDDDIPSSLIFSILFGRLISILRGLFFNRSLIFIEKKVTILGKSRLNIGKYSTLCEFSKIDGYASNVVKTGERFKLGAYSIISCTSHLSKLGKGIQFGHDCGISEYCYFGSSGGILIGNSVIIGQYVSFHSEEHTFDNLSINIKEQGVTSQGIVVGNNVWIGAKATILDGSNIGNNCVVAAGAVVKGVFPNNCVIGGIPAKILKKI